MLKSVVSSNYGKVEVYSEHRITDTKIQNAVDAAKDPKRQRDASHDLPSALSADSVVPTMSNETDPHSGARFLQLGTAKIAFKNDPRRESLVGRRPNHYREGIQEILYQGDKARGKKLHEDAHLVTFDIESVPLGQRYVFYAFLKALLESQADGRCVVSALPKPKPTIRSSLASPASRLEYQEKNRMITPALDCGNSTTTSLTSRLSLNDAGLINTEATERRTARLAVQELPTEHSPQEAIASTSFRPELPSDPSRKELPGSRVPDRPDLRFSPDGVVKRPAAPAQRENAPGTVNRRNVALPMRPAVVPKERDNTEQSSIASESSWRTSPLSAYAPTLTPAPPASRPRLTNQPRTTPSRSAASPKSRRKDFDPDYDFSGDDSSGDEEPRSATAQGSQRGDSQRGISSSTPTPSARQQSRRDDALRPSASTSTSAPPAGQPSLTTPARRTDTKQSGQSTKPAASPTTPPRIYHSGGRAAVMVDGEPKWVDSLTAEKRASLGINQGTSVSSSTSEAVKKNPQPSQQMPTPKKATAPNLSVSTSAPPKATQQSRKDTSKPSAPARPLTLPIGSGPTYRLPANRPSASASTSAPPKTTQQTPIQRKSIPSQQIRRVPPYTAEALQDALFEKMDADMQQLYSAAKQNDSAAQSELGQRYLRGIDIPQSDTEAFKWLVKAAKQDNAEAQFYLGLIYEGERGVPKNKAKAVECYKKAAEQGVEDAQYKLGIMYYTGDDVPKSDIEAFKWLVKAAEQDNAQAQYNLGIMYLNGVRGVTQSNAKAFEWFEKAAKPGHRLAGAQYNLGIMCENGKGVAKDATKALEWYKKAAQQGDERAQANLDRLLASA